MFETMLLRAPDDLAEVYWVRDEVFTKEQGFTVEDVDEYDATATHALVRHEGKPIATARTFCDEQGLWHVGRVCVLSGWRGKDLGVLLMRMMDDYAAAQGAKRIALGAQVYAIPFYERCGYRPTGTRYLDDGCEHEMMEKVF